MGLVTWTGRGMQVQRMLMVGERDNRLRALGETRDAYAGAGAADGAAHGHGPKGRNLALTGSFDWLIWLIWP